VPVYDAHDAVVHALPGSYGSGTRSGVYLVPIFMIERRFAADIEASAEAADMLNRINEQEGVRWLYSFLSADKRKTYCLYEAPFADAIRRAAARAGIPADAIVEVSARLLPAGSVTDSPIE
jgi:Nickel responsive protein SCO4226-like